MPERPRNILYLIDYLLGTEGGTERQVFELIGGLDRKRYIPALAALRPTDFLKKADIPCDKKFLNIARISSPATFLKMIGMAAEIHRSRINLVHVFFNDAAIIAPPFCRMGGARVITSRRDMGFWYTPSILSAMKFSNLFVDRIAANSEAVKKNVSRLEGFPEDRIDVLFNGMNADRFNSAADRVFRKRLGIGPIDPIVGMVSNLYPVKRPADLIRALSIIHGYDKNVHLVFAGGGPPEIKPLQEFAKMNNVDGKVHFLGLVRDVVPVVRHFDVCVLCSESEGLSNAILEYMACAKPVVCTNVGGNSELVKDGVNGFLTEPGNIERLAKLILKLLDDYSLRVTFGENGRKICLGNFGHRKMITEYMELYDRVLNKNNNRKLQWGWRS